MAAGSPPATTGLGRWAALTIFLLLTVGGGLAIGYVTRPGEWYAGLEKPVFNPPSWVFSPVWTILYVLIAVAGWRTWMRAPRSAAMRLWWAQLVLNFLWSPVFFGAEQIAGGLVVILLLLAAIAGFIVAALGVDKVSAWLFVPYAGWVAFATALNASILALN